MERIHIGSENVISAGYDSSASAGFYYSEGILEVEFQDGEIWQYGFLPERAVKAFKESPEEFLKSFQKDNGQHFEKWGFTYRVKNGFGIRNGVLEKYFGNDESVIVPSEVKQFDRGAFYNNEKISSIDIPEGFTELPDSVFYGCKNLISVKLPDSLEKINRDAFSECRNLTKINIPANCKEIGERAFFKCEKLKEIVLPSDLQSIGTSAFDGCTSLHKVVVPEGVTELKHRVFADCANLEEIYIPGSVQKISYAAFVKSLKIDYITPAGSYAEKFFKEEKKDNPAERKERKFQEWRKIFNFSSRKKGAFISEVFVNSPIIYVPDNIGKMCQVLVPQRGHFFNYVGYYCDCLSNYVIISCSIDICVIMSYTSQGGILSPGQEESISWADAVRHGHWRKNAGELKKDGAPAKAPTTSHGSRRMTFRPKGRSAGQKARQPGGSIT